ncbi:nuclear speckle RNA-binding protein B-like [Impatiens glandulifera]|uniref:nuclear speckle RNA-binding protein B-like n=1 Tax=Impatiens glandulifera TaxID=253017 RepID=UPI001FB11806|nr:nuclear speckle RNA-binding protein B-like [Impatiens glandulifera]
MNLDPAGNGSGRSPRKQSQSPLNLISKESHKIKKPQVAAPPPHRRPPTIIYDVSPEIIHTDPTQFMSVVQRLTGASSTATSAASAASAASSIRKEGLVSDNIPVPAASPSLSCPPPSGSYSVVIPSDNNNNNNNNIVSPDITTSPDTFNDLFDF